MLYIHNLCRFQEAGTPCVIPFMNLFGLPRLKAQDLLKGPKNYIEFMLFTFNSHLLRISSTITRGLFSVMCHYPRSDHQSYVSEKNYTLNWKTSPWLLCQPVDIPWTIFRNCFYWMQ